MQMKPSVSFWFLSAGVIGAKVLYIVVIYAQNQLSARNAITASKPKSLSPKQQEKWLEVRAEK